MDELAYITQVTRCSHTAAYSLLVWDWLLNLDEEYELIYRGRWTPAKVAFLVSRYYPLVSYPVVIWVQGFDHDRNLCGRIFTVPMFLVLPNIVSAELILILRTYAFAGGSKLILCFLLACLAGALTYQIWVAISQAALVPVGNSCFPVNRGTKSYLGGYFLSTFILDSIITLIFALCALRIIRLRLTAATHLTQLLLREGFTYFILISAVNLVNAAFNLQSHASLATGAVPLSLLFSNVLTCRLVLNLRKVSQGDTRHSEDVTDTTATATSSSARSPRNLMNLFSLNEVSGFWSASRGTVFLTMPSASQVASFHNEADDHWRRAHAEEWNASEQTDIELGRLR